MVNIVITKKGDNYLSFESSGHAGDEEEGQNLICCAISVLSINTLNSIDAFTEDMINVRHDDGYLFLEFVSGISPESKLLMDSLVLGLSQLKDNYNNEYLKITFREV